MKMYPEVTIELNPPYNGTYGATRLINQTIDVLFSSRELRPVDITNFRAKFGYDPLSVPISGSDVVTTSSLNNLVFQSLLKTGSSTFQNRYRR